MPSSTFYLLFLLPVFSLSEVTTFTRCPQFFFGGATPTILQDQNNQNRYKQICQCLLAKNLPPKYFYATLYDTKYKIPVYSAYEFHSGNVDRADGWYVEPQLDGGTVMCMDSQRKIPKNNQGMHQALNKDYTNSSYHKGHLFPVHHTNNQDAMRATFTLTNAAPQDPKFNCGQWKKTEGDLKTQLQNCNKAFIVTGVIPGNQDIGNNVRVAEYYWNAYCCLGVNNAMSSGGYMGPFTNNNNNNNCTVKSFTLQALETELQNKYNVNSFSVFQGLC